MKTIKEAAHEYFRKAQLGLENPGSESGFIAGVKFAQRWISVEEELPNFDKYKYPNGDFEIFLVKMSTGSISPKIKYCVANLIAEGRWSCESDWSVVTHWRPIELK